MTFYSVHSATKARRAVLVLNSLKKFHFLGLLSAENNHIQECFFYLCVCQDSDTQNNSRIEGRKKLVLVTKCLYFKKRIYQILDFLVSDFSLKNAYFFCEVLYIVYLIYIVNEMEFGTNVLSKSCIFS